MENESKPLRICRATHKHSHEQESQVAARWPDRHHNLSTRMFLKKLSLKRRNSRSGSISVQQVPEQKSIELLEQNQIEAIQEENQEQPVEEVTHLDLAELLEVPPGSDSNKAVDGVCCAVWAETNSGQQNQKHSDLCLIRTSVSRHFPEPPEDLEQNLSQHLDNVKNTLINEFQRLVPKLDEHLMAQVMDRYHRHTFTHLDGLLQNTSSSKNHFLLMNWVLKTYLSQELLGHPGLQTADPIKKVDLLLWIEWEAKARDQLLGSVQKNVRDSLERILQHESSKGRCDSEEDYVKVYVDTIQCTEAVHKAARGISTKLTDYVQKVSFQELLTFVKSYKAEQTEVLERTTRMEKPETIHFLKSLKTCKELRQYVHTNGPGTSSWKEIVQTLDNMEALTVKFLMDIVTKFTEMHLKQHFHSDKRFSSLFSAIETHFPKLSYGADEQKRAMDKVYELIVKLYVQHLTQTNKSKLEKCWGSDVSRRIGEDAEQLHAFISERAPGVKQQNLTLLKITELLDCTCTEALKLTAASIEHECLPFRKNPELLPALMRWKGLSKGDVMEVMDTIRQYQDQDQDQNQNQNQDQDQDQDQDQNQPKRRPRWLRFCC